MGAGCFFTLLTPFTDHIVVWILLILTTASQGIYIGAVSLFSPQVVGYARKKWHKCKQKQSQDETGVNSSNRDTKLVSLKHNLNSENSNKIL